MTLITCPRCSGAGLILKPTTTQCKLCSGTGKWERIEITPEEINLAPSEPVRAVISKQYKIVLLGEAWGEQEARMGMPFVGASGNELNNMLEEAGINRSDCFVTNVFNLQPQPTNDVKNLGTERKLSNVPMPEFQRGVYLQNQYFPEVQRLWDELEQVRPNLVVAFGNTALWALTGNYGIRSLRGTITESTFGPKGLKVLPTYHPAAVLRDWSIRSVVVADLMKAARQAKFPEIRRPSRKIWLEPDLRDIEYFYHKHWIPATKGKYDIETAGQTQITCVGFAPSNNLAIVIPFVDNRKPDGSYWPNPHQEKLAWEWVGRFLQHEENPYLELGGQNTLYDINWLWTKVGITPRNYVSDTMLKHHAYSPEHEKGLGFLGSIYTDEPAWKLMRKSDATKRGE